MLKNNPKKINFVKKLLWEYEYMIKEHLSAAFIETIAYKLSKFIKDETDN